MTVDYEQEVRRLVEGGMSEEEARAIVFEPPFDIVYGPDGEPLEPDQLPPAAGDAG